MSQLKYLTLILIMLSLFFLAGCGPIIYEDLSTNFVGGGTIPSAADTSKKATFGFRFDGTVDPARIHGTYHDKPAGVSLRFTGVVHFWSGEGEVVPCMAATLNYIPLGIGNGDGGTLDLTACDGGIEGNGDTTEDDAIYIKINTGPFAEYQNFGELLGGNLKDLRDKGKQ